jgi:signal transduction histidine kinase
VTPSRRLSPIGARLALAFVGVALAAVVVLAGLTAIGTHPLVGAGLAALVALIVAVFVSGRITRPLVTLTAAARDVAEGSRDRVDIHAPGEIGELASAFDTMVTALDRQDELRRAVVADVAHELRTPLTILQGACEALQDGLEAPTPERLASLHDEILRLARLVEDLEALAAAEAAGLHLERAPVDLASVVDDAVRSLADQAADAGVALTTDLQSVAIDGDASRLRQVAVNLVTNAIKFSPRGGEITITVAPLEGLARLEVRDNGPGVPADDIPHVFERFWRGRGATSTSGSGIGLAVVAQLVRAHRGQVRVANLADGGACFTVLLPRG